MKKYQCAICGYEYEEAVGIPEEGIPAGTKWEDVPPGFVCPACAGSKSVFILKD